jgi:class 3 adenylate cyclase
MMSYKVFKSLLLVFIVFQSSYFVSAQTPKIDSLFIALKKAVEDTNKVKTLQQIAKELHWQGSYQSSLDFASQSLQLSKKLNFRKGQGNAYLVLGQVSTSNNSYPIAHKYLDSCIILRQQLNDKAGIAAAHIYASDVYHMEDDYPQAISQLLKAEKIYDALNDTAGIVYLYNIYGILYLDYGQTKEGIEYLLKASNAYRNNGNMADLSLNLSALSMAYLEHGTPGKALSSIKEAIAIRSDLGLSPVSYNNLYLAKVYVQIAERLEGARKFAAANDTLALALKEMSSIVGGFEKGNDYMGKVNSYITLGKIHLGLNNLMDANRYFKKCLALSLETNNLLEARDSYLYLSKMYSREGKVADAFKNFKKYIVFRDSIANQNSTKEIAHAEMKYAAEKQDAIAKAMQDKRDAIARSELRRQRTMRNAFVAGFIFMLISAGVFFVQRNKIRKGKRRSDELLLNILPSEVAEELKEKGSAEARLFNDVTVMFTDFENFTQMSEKLTPAELIAEIDTCFKAFDRIIGNYKIEKIKTIGDSYMCAGGLPVSNQTHSVDIVNAAVEVQQFTQKYMQQRIEAGKDPFRIRIGIHTGPVVAGIVGLKKFAYDIWGDTVNIASRMESSGEAGKINISGTTYQLVRENFSCTYRGKIKAKNKGEVDMYFVETLKS